MFNRSRKMAAAMMMAALGGLTAGSVGGKAAPVAKVKGKARTVNPNARYHGGKHTSGAMPHIHEQYINEAQFKRKRKNLKRYEDNSTANAWNPCIKAA